MTGERLGLAGLDWVGLVGGGCTGAGGYGVLALVMGPGGMG